MKPLYDIDNIDVPSWTQVLATDESERDRHLVEYKAMISGYHGQAYESADGKVTPENFYYSYVTATVPGLVTDNPRVVVRSRRAGAEDPVSMPMRHGLNRWVRDERFSETLKLIATDFCFAWGVGMVTNEPDRSQGVIADQALFDENNKLREKDGKKYRPRFYRLSPKLFSIDSRALNAASAGHMSHVWFMSAADLKEEVATGEGWNVKEATDLVSGASSGKDAASMADPARDQRNPTKKADEIEFRSVWVPSMIVDGKGPDEGYHGAILTFARTNSGEAGRKFVMPKEPEPYFGPKSGPYVVFGAHSVPDKLWPLGPLTASQSAIKELNRHARSISKSNSRGKQVVLYDKKNKAEAEQIQNAEGEFLIGIEGFDKANFATAVFGFAPDALYKAHAMHKDQLQRGSGMNDAQQGNVTGKGTATENQISNETTLRRNNALYKQFVGGTDMALYKVAHFFYWDDDIAFPLGEEFLQEVDVPMGEGQYAMFEGGQQKGNKGISFEDYELEIEAFSMGRTDQAQLSASLQQFMGYLIPTLQLRPMTPFVDWQALDELYAQQLNTPELAGIVDNVAAAQQQPWQDGGETPSATFSRDLLPAGAGRPQVQMNRPPNPMAPPGGAPAPQMPQQAPGL